MIGHVTVEQLQILSAEDLRSIGSAMSFLQDSLTLKAKKIAGKFLDFDDRMCEHRDVVVLDFNNQYCNIPTDNIVTIVNGWVISD